MQGYGATTTDIYEDWQVVDHEGEAVMAIDTTSPSLGTPEVPSTVDDDRIVRHEGSVLIIDGHTLATALRLYKPLFKEVAL